MKTLLLILIASFPWSIDQQEIDSTPYMKAMSLAVTALEESNSAVELQECKDSFDRMVKLYKKQWLPMYYSAYCSIELVYWDHKNRALNEERLETAEKLLHKLDKMDKVDRSEVANLWGYYYMCLISTDPLLYAYKHFETTIEKFREALEYNPENPRPIVLLVLFEQRFKDRVHYEVNHEQKKELAEEFFKKETRNFETPYWGREFLDGIQIDKKKKKKK